METFAKKMEPVIACRTIVGALFVEQDAIYCACKVVKDSHRIFTLHKYEHDGTFIFYMEGFNHIRGIAKDSSGNFYISDSLAGNRVIKFDNDWNPLRKTNNFASETIDDPYGIYLDEDVVKERNIYLCSKDQICILDEELNIRYSLALQFCPLDVTKLSGRIFVTAKSAIYIMDINFSQERFKCTMYNCMMSPEGEAEHFKGTVYLRGICNNGQYLYVTEKGPNGRLLCLEFSKDKDKLLYVDAENNCTKHCSPGSCSPDCSPVVVVHHNGNMYYSQGTREREYHIIKITHEPGTPLTSKKIFDA